MLLNIFKTEIQEKQAKLQAQIRELQAEEEKTLSELRQVDEREERMDVCLAMVREILEESQQRPQEAFIFSSALDDEINSFGFGNLDAPGGEIAELRSQLEQMTQDRDRLLVRIGNTQFDWHEDAKRRIGELEEQLSELDSHNCKLEKQYDQLNALWLQADKKRGELQAQVEELMAAPTVSSAQLSTDEKKPEAEVESEAEESAQEAQLSYSQQVRAIASEFFGYEITNKAGLKKAIRNHAGTTFMQALSLETDGSAFYQAAEAQITRLKEQQEQNQMLAEPGIKLDYCRQIEEMASEFFGYEITSKAALKEAIANHPDTSMEEDGSLKLEGRAFYQAAEAQINRLKELSQQFEQQEEAAESVWLPNSPNIVPIEELRKLPAVVLRSLAEKKGIDCFGSLEAIAWDLKGLVTSADLADAITPAHDTVAVKTESVEQPSYQLLREQLNNCKSQQEFLAIALELDSNLTPKEKEELIEGALLHCDPKAKIECSRLLEVNRALLRKQWSELASAPATPDEDKSSELELDRYGVLIARLNECKSEEEFIAIASNLDPALNATEKEEFLEEAFLYCDPAPKYNCTQFFNSSRFLLRKRWKEQDGPVQQELFAPIPACVPLGELMKLSHKTLILMAQNKDVSAEGTQSEIATRLVGRVLINELEEFKALGEVREKMAEAEAELEAPPTPESGFAAFEELITFRLSKLQDLARKHGVNVKLSKKDLATGLENKVTIKELYSFQVA